MLKARKPKEVGSKAHSPQNFRAESVRSPNTRRKRTFDEASISVPTKSLRIPVERLAKSELEKHGELQLEFETPRRNDQESISDVPKEDAKVPKEDAKVPNENADGKTNANRKIAFSHEADLMLIERKLVKAIKDLPCKTTLSKFTLRNCSVNAKVLRRARRAAKEKKVRARKIDLSGNKQLDMPVVSGLIKELGCDSLDLSNTGLDETRIKDLGELEQLKNLWLNYNTFEDHSVVKTLVKLINNGLEGLSLVDSRITDDHFQAISLQISTRISLKRLDLSHVTLTNKSIVSVGRIVNKTKGMERLVLSNCILSEKLLRSFAKVIKVEILELDLSSNQKITEGNVESISMLLDKVNCKTIDLSGIPLNGRNIKQLMEYKKPSKLQNLLLTENLSIDTTEVGTLAKTWELKSIDISECRLNPQQILDLAEAIGDHKLHSIDVSDPMALLTDERKQALEKLEDKKARKDPQHVIME